jgi:alpha-amylase
MVALIATFLLSILSPALSAHSPEEWRDRTIYQVLTDRFAGPDSSSCNLGDYCGGTFQGLTSKLDYIADLGFDAIWISPVVENTDGGYHGYWAKNLSAINNKFGTKEDLHALVEAAHAKSMWIMVDVVGNHMGGSIGQVSSYAPFNQNDHYHDCTGCPSNCAITDFQTLYSHNCEHCRLEGLPDLNQDNSYVSSQLTSWIKDLVDDYNFDGIRVDTVPEVKPAFWKLFNDAAGCYAIGEVFNGDIKYVSPFQGQALDGVLSYPMFFQIRNVFASGKSFSMLQTLSDSMPSQFLDVSLLGTFLDNHDNVRFLNINSDRTKYKNALLHVLFSSGIPIIYYGTEQGFDGGSDPDCREIMWPTEYDTTNDLYQFLKLAIATRKKTKAWSLGYPKWYWADDSFGLFAKDQTMLVATTNVGNEDISRVVPLGGFKEGAQYCDALDQSYCSNIQGGKISINLSNGMPRVMVLSGSLLESI